MRTLSANLLAAQKLTTLDAAYRVVLTHASPPGGQNASYTYYLDAHSGTRLLKQIENHTEELYLQEATVFLDNSDKSLNSIDFRGYTAVISYGAWISGAGDYSACANLYVVNQGYTDAPNDLRIILHCKGDMWKLENDRASANVTPADDDARTVKDWIREVMGDSGVTHLAEYNHCTAYDVTFDSEDTLIDSYCPNDGFRIYRNGTRLSALRRLLDHTKCIARFENDGELHVFEPVTSGVSYDYEYKFNVANEHEFFSKVYQESATVPNYIIVDTIPDADTAYQGTASVSEKIGVFNAYYQKALASDSEGDDLAEAILSKLQLHKQIGQVSAPFINAGQEPGDYIKVTSSRSGKDRAGNISVVTRNVNPVGEMTLSFGGWLSAKGITSLLETYDENYAAFSRLSAKDAYIENLQASSIDLTSITQDDIENGGTYGRILKTHISEGKIKLTSETVVDGYDLDGLPNGSTFERVKATQIEDGKIELTSTSFLINENQVRFGVADANRLELKSTGIKGFSYVGEVETEEFHIDAEDGTIKCAGGYVVLDSNGVTCTGQTWLIFKHSDSVTHGAIGAYANYLTIATQNGKHLSLAPVGDMLIGGSKLGVYGTVPNARQSVTDLPPANLGLSGTYSGDYATIEWWIEYLEDRVSELQDALAGTSGPGIITIA